MMPKDSKLKEWLFLELMNHIHFDEMLDTHKDLPRCKCDVCECK